MQISINELLEGKATIIKDKEYLATKDYVQPFLDKMKPFTNDFRVKVKVPDQITKDDDKDITFNRVLVEAVLPKEHTIDNHDEVIGFLYGLDIKKPIAKIYRGYLNRACTNLSVFQPQWLKVQEIEPETNVNFEVKELFNMENNFKLQLEGLKKTFFPREQMHEALGSWVDFCLTNTYDNGIHTVKLSPQLPIKAYKSLFIDQDSKYYVKESVEPTVFDVHEAMTQIITDDKKDLLSAFEKTIMVNQMMNLNLN